jgi:hypothetical protein
MTSMESRGRRSRIVSCRDTYDLLALEMFAEIR